MVPKRYDTTLPDWKRVQLDSIGENSVCNTKCFFRMVKCEGISEVDVYSFDDIHIDLNVTIGNVPCNKLNK